MGNSIEITPPYIRIDKEKLTIDIDTGSREVRDNIIENTGFEYLNDDDYILSYDTKTSIVFCTKERLLQAIEFNLEEADQEDYSNMDFSEFDSVFDEELASFFLTYLESLDEDSNKYFQSMVDFIYETIYDRYSANCDYCNEEKGNYETTLLLSGKVICNDCFYKGPDKNPQEITLQSFKSLVNNAYAISLDDGEIRTKWQMVGCEVVIYDGISHNYISETYSLKDVCKILFTKDEFQLYNDTNEMIRVKLFSLSIIKPNIK